MIERVRLKNFLSHSDTEISLDEGVDVFVGPNGAGKSSVIDTITFALYGEHTRAQAKNLVRRGSLEGSASVVFTSAGRRYLAERKLGRTGRLESAVLKELTDGAKTIVAGERRQYGESMSEEVSRLIGLDYRKMKVASIIQQGELDAIIRYQPRELKELINALIGIDDLDVAFQNMKDLIDGFRAKLRETCMNYDDRGIGEVQTKIEELDSEMGNKRAGLRSVTDELAKLHSEESALSSRLDELRALSLKAAAMVERRRALQEYVMRRAQEIRAEAVELREEARLAREHLQFISVRGEAIQKDGEELRRLKDAASEARAKAKARLDALEGVSRRASALDASTAGRRARIEGLRASIDRLSQEVGSIDLMGRPTDMSYEELLGELQALTDERVRVSEDMARASSRLGDYEGIRSSGVCPTCGTRLELIASDLDRRIAELRERAGAMAARLKEIDERTGQLGRLIELERKYEEGAKRRMDLSASLEHQREELAFAEREQANEIDERGRLEEELQGRGRLEEELQGREAELARLAPRIEENRALMEKLLSARSWMADHRISGPDDISSIESRVVEDEALLSRIPADLSKVEQLSIDEHSGSLVKEIMALEAETKGYSDAELSSVNGRLMGVRGSIADRQVAMGGLQASIAAAEEELGRLRNALEKLRAASEYVSFSEAVRNNVLNRDGPLATSLRSWALRQMSVSASAYARLFGIGISEVMLKEVKRDVMIECYGAGAGAIDVNAMSGGERMAIALALRFAMANLMGGGRVDFILLDEPTANLDEERKKSLVKVISQLNPQSGASPLKQIIVITHDREIFDDADVNEVYRFEKTSNGSSVSRE